MPAYAIGALSRNSATPPIKSPSPDTQGDTRPMVYVAPLATIAFSQASESSRSSIVPTWPSSNSGTLFAGDGTAAMLLSSGAALNVMPPLLGASGGAPGVGAGRGVGVGGVATPLPGVMVITTTTPKLDSEQQGRSYAYHARSLYRAPPPVRSSFRYGRRTGRSGKRTGLALDFALERVVLEFLTRRVEASAHLLRLVAACLFVFQPHTALAQRFPLVQPVVRSAWSCSVAEEFLRQR